MKFNDLLFLGFALLFSGIFLTTALGDSLPFQIIGLIIIIISSVIFGASIRTTHQNKK